MPELEFRHAIREALDEELARDDRVIFFGEDVAAAGRRVRHDPGGLQEKHGADRVFDTPISELALTGAAFGSAVCGLRPVIEIMFGDFLPLSMDSLVNQAAKYWYLSNEQGQRAARRPLGDRRRRALRRDPLADADQLVPRRPRAEDRRAVDARPTPRRCSRRRSATTTRSSSSSTSACTRSRSEVERRAWRRSARPRVVREGADVTLVSGDEGRSRLPRGGRGAGRPRASSAEVIDLRTLRPLDASTILRSLAKTNRLRRRRGGAAHRRLGRRGRRRRCAEHGLHDLDDVWRLTTPDHPIPYSPPLEDAFLPGAEAIAASVRSRLSRYA